MTNPSDILNPKSGEMRDALAEYLVNMLKQQRYVEFDDEGDKYLAPLPSHILSAANTFLKNFPPADLPHAGEVDPALQEYITPLPFPKQA